MAADDDLPWRTLGDLVDVVRAFVDPALAGTTERWDPGRGFWRRDGPERETADNDAIMTQPRGPKEPETHAEPCYSAGALSWSGWLDDRKKPGRSSLARPTRHDSAICFFAQPLDLNIMVFNFD